MRYQFYVACCLVALIVASAACSGNTTQIRAAIAPIVAAAPARGVAPAVWTDVRAFYAHRDGAPAWVDRDSPTSRARTAIALLEHARDHGLAPGRYDHPALAEAERTLVENGTGKSDRDATLAAFDVRLTTALLALGRDVAIGAAGAETRGHGPHRRQAPDLAGTLSAAAGGRELATWLDAIKPLHPQYAALQRALADLYADADQAGAAEDRVNLLATNLDRWRYLPDDLGERHILVNIPQYHLFVRERGTAVLDMKVIVGKPGNNTPAFSGRMTTVVFSPYWNIPDSIAVGETAPAVARDGRYLEKNQIEILRRTKSGTTRVDPGDVDWDDPEALKELAFRQKPGAGNALGHVKFLFPNEFNVYLHDTPSDNLFEREGRALSHGCVRLDQPEALAAYVLRGESEWDAARIKDAMFAGVERQVPLAQPIPVHLVYFTAWIDDSGQVQVLPDIYQYDRAPKETPGRPRS